MLGLYLLSTFPLGLCSPSCRYNGETPPPPTKNDNDNDNDNDRFCPVSLCLEHYGTDPSGVIGNTQAALEHRARHPFPRSRIGAPVGGWRKKARGRGRASYKTPPLNRPGRGRGGRSMTPPGGLPSETIAARRPKRSVAATSAPASVVDAACLKKMRRESGETKAVELMAEGRRVRAGWFARREFVCRGCKMAMKRAVRQYGLLGSLETDGIVLPFGESEVSGRPRR